MEPKAVRQALGKHSRWTALIRLDLANSDRGTSDLLGKCCLAQLQRMATPFER
jgi:hypothetical protein